MNSLEGDVATAFILATALPGLLNNTHEKITTLQNQLTIKIDVLSANVTTETLSISSILSGEADQAIRTTEGFVILQQFNLPLTYEPSMCLSHVILLVVSDFPFLLELTELDLPRATIL